MEKGEKKFLKEYDIAKFERPSVTVDLVIFTVIDNELKVLLIKRGMPPFEGYWALPGGFVRIDESLREAARRELKEETGINPDEFYLEQLYTFGEPKRDPRARVITVAHYALVDSRKIKPYVTGMEEIKAVQWHHAHNLPEKLAFDHKDIINYAITRLKYKLEYTAVGLELLPEFFTLTDLQKLYEEILNEKLDKRNFRKKIFSMDIIEATKQFKKGGHRPAMLYKFKKAKPPISTFKKTKFEQH
jgi:8-oxo-dGTP diphosphatase